MTHPDLNTKLDRVILEMEREVTDHMEAYNECCESYDVGYIDAVIEVGRKLGVQINLPQNS